MLKSDNRDNTPFFLSSCSSLLILSKIGHLSKIYKHNLIDLRKIVQEKSVSLLEEIERATNAKLNPLYTADRRDKIEFVGWEIKIINSFLKWDKIQKHLQVEATRVRIVRADRIEFEGTLQTRLEDLILRLRKVG